MKTKTLKKILLCLIVLLMVMAGTLAWLTTSEYKKGKLGAGELSLTVEKVNLVEEGQYEGYYITDGAAEEAVATENAKENPSYTAAVHYANDGDETEGLIPISTTNEQAIEKRETKYIRITNNSDTDNFVEMSFKNFSLYNNEDGSAVTDTASLNEAFKSVTLLLPSVEGSNVNNYTNCDSFNNDYYEILTFGDGDYGYSNMNINADPMLYEEDMEIGEMDHDLYSFAELKAADYKIALPFILKAHSSVVLPFKVFLNENASNLLQENTVYYEIEVKARNYMTGDSVTTASGNSVMEDNTAKEMFLTMVSVMHTQALNLRAWEENTATTLLQWTYSNPEASINDLNTDTREALLESVEETAKDTLSEEDQDDSDKLTEAVKEMNNKVTFAINNPDDEEAQAIANETVANVENNIPEDSGAGDVFKQENYSDVLEAYKPTIDDENIIIIDRLINKYYDATDAGLTTVMMQRTALNSMRTYTKNTVLDNLDEILPSDYDPGTKTEAEILNDALTILDAMDASDALWKYIVVDEIDNTDKATDDELLMSPEELLKKYLATPSYTTHSGKNAVLKPQYQKQLEEAIAKAQAYQASKGTKEKKGDAHYVAAEPQTLEMLSKLIEAYYTYASRNEEKPIAAGELNEVTKMSVADGGDPDLYTDMFTSLQMILGKVEDGVDSDDSTIASSVNATERQIIENLTRELKTDGSEKTEFINVFGSITNPNGFTAYNTVKGYVDNLRTKMAACSANGNTWSNGTCGSSGDSGSSSGGSTASIPSNINITSDGTKYDYDRFSIEISYTNKNNELIASDYLSGSSEIGFYILCGTDDNGNKNFDADYVKIGLEKDLISGSTSNNLIFKKTTDRKSDNSSPTYLKILYDEQQNDYKYSNLFFSNELEEDSFYEDGSSYTSLSSGSYHIGTVMVPEDSDGFLFYVDEYGRTYRPGDTIKTCEHLTLKEVREGDSYQAVTH